MKKLAVTLLLVGLALVVPMFAVPPVTGEKPSCDLDVAYGCCDHKNACCEPEGCSRPDKK